MQSDFDFSKAKRAKNVPHLAALQARAKDPKKRITILLDGDVVSAFRKRADAEGKGYQTLINETLRRAISPDASPVTVDALRRVLREVLHSA